MSEEQLSEKSCRKWMSQVTQNKPLVHCITNFVSMDLMANCLCTVGASPAMVNSPHEVEEFAHIAHVLLVNVGTLSEEWLCSMMKAVKAFNAEGKPWVLDPVAAGGTKYRTEAILGLLKLGPTLVRGNASEIASLADNTTNMGGVDSLELGRDVMLAAAKKLALKYQTIVAVSGPVDYVTDGSDTYAVRGGHPLLTRLSASGCTVTALIAAFLAVPQSREPEGKMLAATFALAVFGYAACLAAGSEGHKTLIGPGTFRSRLLDELYQCFDDSSQPLHIAVSKE